MSPLTLPLRCGLNVEIKPNEDGSAVTACIRFRPHGAGIFAVSPTASTNEITGTGLWSLWVGGCCIDLDGAEQAAQAQQWIDQYKAERAAAQVLA